ncbi:MAG: hypothetical protein LBJ93_02435 [Clostridiales bacterium]|nr:hypothetical protein [Clostridiales bacterium]
MFRILRSPQENIVIEYFSSEEFDGYVQEIESLNNQEEKFRLLCDFVFGEEVKREMLIHFINKTEEKGKVVKCANELPFYSALKAAYEGLKKILTRAKLEANDFVKLSEGTKIFTIAKFYLKMTSLPFRIRPVTPPPQEREVLIRKNLSGEGYLDTLTRLVEMSSRKTSKTTETIEDKTFDLILATLRRIINDIYDHLLWFRRTGNARDDLLDFICEKVLQLFSSGRFIFNDYMRLSGHGEKFKSLVEFMQSTVKDVKFLAKGRRPEEEPQEFGDEILEPRVLNQIMRSICEFLSSREIHRVIIAMREINEESLEVKVAYLEKNFFYGIRGLAYLIKAKSIESKEAVLSFAYEKVKYVLGACHIEPEDFVRLAINRELFHIAELFDRKVDERAFKGGLPMPPPPRFFSKTKSIRSKTT